MHVHPFFFSRRTTDGGKRARGSRDQVTEVTTVVFEMTSDLDDPIGQIDQSVLKGVQEDGKLLDSEMSLPPQKST